MSKFCNHFFSTHSHIKGLQCISCGIEVPDTTYQLSGDYKKDVESLIDTIEMLKRERNVQQTTT